MAVVALYINKRLPTRGGFEDFGNTYHYSVPTIENISLPILANLVRAAEQTVTASDVDFLGWSAWGPTDGPEFENVILDSGEWEDQSGESGGAFTGYETAALLFRWPLPRSEQTNRKRWCFKYIRGFQYPGMMSEQIDGREAIPQDIRDSAYSDYGSVVANPQIADGELDLCTADGTNITGQGQLRPYVTTRQIRK